MNKLTLDKQTLILSSLVVGNSIRSIERITGVHIMRLMVWAGNKAQAIMDNDLMNLNCNLIQVDEIWTYVAKKQKNVRKEVRNSNSELPKIPKLETNMYMFLWIQRLSLFLVLK